MYVARRIATLVIVAVALIGPTPPSPALTRPVFSSRVVLGASQASVLQPWCGLTAAVVGLNAVTAVTLAVAAIDDAAELVLMLAVLGVLLRWKSRVAIVTVITGAGALAAIATLVT